MGGKGERETERHRRKEIVIMMGKQRQVRKRKGSHPNIQIYLWLAIKSIAVFPTIFSDRLIAVHLSAPDILWWFLLVLKCVVILSSCQR